MLIQLNISRGVFLNCLTTATTRVSLLEVKDLIDKLIEDLHSVILSAMEANKNVTGDMLRQLEDFYAEAQIKPFLLNYFCNSIQQLYTNYAIELRLSFYDHLLAVRPNNINLKTFYELNKKMRLEYYINSSIMFVIQRELADKVTENVEITVKNKISHLTCDICKKLVYNEFKERYCILTNNEGYSYSFHKSCFEEISQNIDVEVIGKELTSSANCNYDFDRTITTPNDPFDQNMDFFDDMAACLENTDTKVPKIVVNKRAMSKFLAYQTDRQIYFNAMFIDT